MLATLYRRYPTLVSLLFGALVLHPQSLAAQDSGPLASQLRTLFSPFVARRDLAGVAAIRDRAGHITQVAVGMADLRFGTVMATRHRFKIGSITKQFTAAAILRLAEQGRIDVAAPVGRYLSAFQSDSGLTIHHLLAHRGGLIRDVVPVSEEAIPHPLSELVARTAAAPREFSPGVRFSYSNAGYTILAAVIEAVSGQSYCKAIDRLLFQPLVMHDTGCETTTDIPIRLVSGYDPSAGTIGLAETPPLDPANGLGAGNLISSSRDLLRWGTALLHEELLQPRSWNQLKADHGSGRGYGVGLYQRAGVEVIGHDGVVNGFVSELEVVPSVGVVAVLLTNIRSGAPDALRTPFLRLALGQSAEQPAVPKDQSAKIDTAEAHRLVGSYQLFPGFLLEVRARDGHLLLQGTGGYPTVLTRLSDGDFYYRAMYARIHFESANDRAERLVWTGLDGKGYPAIRQTVGDTATPRLPLHR